MGSNFILSVLLSVFTIISIIILLLFIINDTDTILLTGCIDIRSGIARNMRSSILVSIIYNNKFFSSASLPSSCSVLVLPVPDFLVSSPKQWQWFYLICIEYFKILTYSIFIVINQPLKHCIDLKANSQ